MEEKNLLDYIAAGATIATPVLLLIFSLIGWTYQTSVKRKLKIEERLRDDQVEVYNKMLYPFIIILSSDAAWEADPKTKVESKEEYAKKEILSLEYRQNAFRLSLIGSDSVVKAFNDLMQYFYSIGSDDLNPPLEDAGKILLLLGDLLLEIRRSMGNENTKIDNLGMLEWFMTDITKYRKNRSVV